MTTVPPPSEHPPGGWEGYGTFDQPGAGSVDRSLGADLPGPEAAPPPPQAAGYVEPEGFSEYDDDYEYDEYDDDYGYDDDEPPYAMAPEEAAAPERGGRRNKRDERLRGRAQAREARWQRHRLAVPYRTDGPRLSFGVLWFALIVGAVLTSPIAVALLVSAVAGLAGLQIGYAWFPRHEATRWWTAAGAFGASLLGVIGSIGVLLAIVVGLAVALAYAVANPSRSQSTSALAEVAMRAIIPVGVASAALITLPSIGVGAALALVAMVSAYEMGDFLVGSGSANAVEGPISGLVSLATVVFILWVVTPAPFTSSSIVLFGMLTGVGCVVGQIFASAILPRGAAWAPALRRLDSYLLVAPLWVLLLGSIPTTTTL